MIRHRTVEEVNRYDMFKLLVTFILIVILFFTVRSQIDRVSTEADPLAEPPPDVTAPSLHAPSGNFTTGVPFTLSGTGRPGDEIEIIADGQRLGRTTVEHDGVWAVEAVLGEPGEHEVFVNSLASDGSVVQSTEPLLIVIAEPE